jgi:poly(A) polymerase
VLGRLSELVKAFVQSAARKNGASEAAALQAGGKIFTFGSYRLGVHGPGADIDTLCVVPKNVTREDFFSIFEDLLRHTEGVEELSVRRPTGLAALQINISCRPSPTPTSPSLR